LDHWAIFAERAHLQHKSQLAYGIFKIARSFNAHRNETTIKRCVRQTISR
jgi:hypothetical protein